MIDLGRALRYPFEGPNGLTKTLLGALFAAFAPVLFLTGFYLLGYQLRIIQDVLRQRASELPDYDDYATGFVRGAQVFFGTLLYSLPAFILAGLGGWVLFSALSDFDLTSYLLYRARPSFDRAELGVVVLCFALALLWMIVSAPLVMAAVGRFAETGEFRVFFDVLNLADVVWDHKKVAASLMLNLFLLAMVMQVANIIVSSFVCFAGSFFNFVHLAAAAHLNGQWAAYLRTHRVPRNVIRPLKPKRG